MDKYKQILITGGTGFIGSYLCERLMRNGHYLTILTRSPVKYNDENSKNQRFISWDTDLIPEMEKADVVINLAGENLGGDSPIGRRWTDRLKKRIYNSRINSTKKLVEAMKSENPPELLISASAISIYGDSGDSDLDEESETGDDFLAKVCSDWEAEALKAEKVGVRVVIPRIGISLEEDGGMLEKLKLPFSLFVGGPIGRGEQYLPWIHMHDLCNALMFPINNTELSGTFNACSPNPATMNELASAMGKVMGRPSIFRVPEFLLKMMLGDGAIPVMQSLKAQPKVLQKAGFEFQFKDLEYTLADIL